MTLKSFGPEREGKIVSEKSNTVFFAGGWRGGKESSGRKNVGRVGSNLTPENEEGKGKTLQGPGGGEPSSTSLTLNILDGGINHRGDRTMRTIGKYDYGPTGTAASEVHCIS